MVIVFAAKSRTIRTGQTNHLFLTEIVDCAKVTALHERELCHYLPIPVTLQTAFEPFD